MQNAYLIAGLSWDPAIRGILAVGTGVVVLIGSVYLLLSTNVGFRLGALVTLSALTGFLTILTAIWWIQPPGIGPRGGADPRWVPLEIYVNPVGQTDQPALAKQEGEYAPPPATDAGGAYPFPYDTATAQKVADLQNKLSATQIAQLPKNYNLSDVRGLEDADPSIKEFLPDRADFNDWKVVPSSQVGEGQAAADVALANSGLFKDATEYKKLEVYDRGGTPTPEDDCPNGQNNPKNLLPEDWACRLKQRFLKTFRIFQPPHYQIANVQRVIPQETTPGEAPPVPEVDPTQPVVSVIMIRDQGNVRLKPAAFFFISAALFIFFTLLLHFRDKTAAANRALEPDSPAAQYAAARAAEAQHGPQDRAGVDKTPGDGGG
ncbi:MAG: hypothetical protein HYX32_11150 [Actinobacteria bacterium]|nr:hypothetical protein [Actinomycetota bacterium]